MISDVYELANSSFDSDDERILLRLIEIAGSHDVVESAALRVTESLSKAVQDNPHYLEGPSPKSLAVSLLAQQLLKDGCLDEEVYKSFIQKHIG